MLGVLITLTVYALVTDPIPRVIRAVVVVLIVLVIIGLLLELAGVSTGIPRWRIGRAVYALSTMGA